MKIVLIIIGILSCTLINAQDTTDVYRLKNMEYMRFTKGTDCNDEDISFLEQRICLNLEFQREDSIMNIRFNTLLSSIDDNDIKAKQKNIQKTWVEKRRLQSQQNADGYRGHHLGIVYLNTMIEITLKRTVEIENLLK